MDTRGIGVQTKEGLLDIVKRSIRTEQHDPNITVFAAILVIRFAPKNPESWNVMGLLAQKYELGEAIPFFQHALKIDRENPEIWFNLGSVQARLGNTNAAKEIFKRVVELDDHYREVDIVKQILDQ